LLQALRKSRQTAVSFRIICSEWREHADAAHALALLRARRQRPRGRRAAEKGLDMGETQDGKKL